MSDAKVLQLGDPCPRCDGELKKAKTPTPEQYHRAYYSEHAGGLPQGYDTMDPAQVPEHGALYICSGCGLQTRFKSST